MTVAGSLAIDEWTVAGMALSSFSSHSDRLTDFEGQILLDAQIMPVTKSAHPALHDVVLD